MADREVCYISIQPSHSICKEQNKTIETTDTKTVWIVCWKLTKHLNNSTCLSF